MPPSLIDLHHHKVFRKGGGHMLQKQAHHLRIGRGQNERGHLAFCSRDRSGPHLRPSLTRVAGRQDRVWPVPLEPPAQSFFKSSLGFWIGFGMTWTRHELAPAVTIQQ